MVRYGVTAVATDFESALDDWREMATLEIFHTFASWRAGQ